MNSHFRVRRRVARDFAWHVLQASASGPVPIQLSENMRQERPPAVARRAQGRPRSGQQSIPVRPSHPCDNWNLAECSAEVTNEVATARNPGALSRRPHPVRRREPGLAEGVTSPCCQARTYASGQSMGKSPPGILEPAEQSHGASRRVVHRDHPQSVTCDHSRDTQPSVGTSERGLQGLCATQRRAARPHMRLTAPEQSVNPAKPKGFAALTAALRVRRSGTPLASARRGPPTSPRNH